MVRKKEVEGLCTGSVIEKASVFGYFFLCAVFFLLFFFNYDVYADTQSSQVTIGNVPPEINNVTIEDEAATFTLTENTSVLMRCNATITDYNGEDDVTNVTARIFSDNNTAHSQPVGINETCPGAGCGDTNYLYVNDTCTLDTGLGDANELQAECSFNVTYFAYNGTWVCNATATDLNNTRDTENDTISIDALTALNIPGTMHFGTVDALNHSIENFTNVTNTGNHNIFIALDGFGRTDGDGLSMNCTSGSTQNISLTDLRYNLTEAQTGSGGDFNQTTFYANYTSLNDSEVNATFFVVKGRENDTNEFVDAINKTFWRVRIPIGAAGTCTGNIVYTAVSA